MLELERDGAIGGGRKGDVKGDGNSVGEHGIRVGDVVRVAEQPKGGERKKEIEDRGVEGVVVRVGAGGVQVALGGEDGGEGLGGRVWV